MNAEKILSCLSHCSSSSVYWKNYWENWLYWDHRKNSSWFASSQSSSDFDWADLRQSGNTSSSKYWDWMDIVASWSCWLVCYWSYDL